MTCQTHLTLVSLDTIPVSAFFALNESFKIFSSPYLITVISLRLYSCSLLSKCGFFGLLFLEIQNGCWFQHFCPFAVSEKQNSPDLAFAPFLARGLSIKQFEYSTHIHNTVTSWVPPRQFSLAAGVPLCIADCCPSHPV